MNRDEMIKFIVDCVAQTYRADAAGISESTNIPEEFGTKSLQRVSLCALIENETDVVLSLGDIGKYPTVMQSMTRASQQVRRGVLE